MTTITRSEAMTGKRFSPQSMVAFAVISASAVMYALSAGSAALIGTPDLSKFFGSSDKSRFISKAIDIVDLAMSWWGFAAALALAGAAAFLVATAKYFAQKYGKRYAVNWLATQ